MKTDEHGTRPVREEAIVIIAGPFVQILIYGFLYAVSSSGVIPDYYFELILYYNTIILLFNLLPIWPLDGGKLVFLALTTFLTFKKSILYNNYQFFSDMRNNHFRTASFLSIYVKQFSYLALLNTGKLEGMEISLLCFYSFSFKEIRRR